jgi:hypothetical protein
LKADPLPESDDFSKILRAVKHGGGRDDASTEGKAWFPYPAMTVFTSKRPLMWGGLDVPMLGLSKDWQGVAVDPPAGFSLAMDSWRLWFVAHHRKPARLHPEARPGRFQENLWQYDVAELFIADPASGRYFEFNLSPNGAWWSCEFTAPRVRAEEVDIAMPEVATFSDMAPDGAWVAALALPLDLLRARLDFGEGTKLNVAFILGSAERAFLSAADLSGGAKDFHQPGKFTPAVFTPLPA